MSDSTPQPQQALQGAHKFDLGIVGAGAVALIGSLMPFYTVSVDFMGVSQSTSANAWHGFFGWFGVLAAVAGSTLVLLHLLGRDTQVPARTAALIAYGVAVVCVVLALFVTPGGDCDEFVAMGVDVCEGFDFGHGFGYWLTLLAVLAGLVLSILRRGTGAVADTGVPPTPSA